MVRSEGSATALKLPGIFDEVVTLTTMMDEQNQPHRTFVCHQMNPWQLPAKDRSGTLELNEAPDLGALLKKIRAGKRIDAVSTSK